MVFSGVTLWNREPGAVSDVIVHVMTLQIIFYGSMFVLFWFGAKSLSTRVAPIHETAQSPHITPLAHLLVAVAGLVFVLSGLAQTPSISAGWLDGTPRSLEHTLTALSKIIVGMAVILGRERIADFMQKARTV